MADYLNAANLAVNADFLRRVQIAVVQAALNAAAETTDEVQSLSVTGGPTGGTFTLKSFDGSQTSAAINWNDTAAAVQSKLTALSTIGAGGVVCTGGPLPGAAITITAAGPNAAMPLQLITIGANNLTGGSTPAPAVGRTTAGVAVAYHAARRALAGKILAAPVQYAALFAPGVVTNATVQADFVAQTFALNGVSETQVANDIQFQVNSILNAYT